MGRHSGASYQLARWLESHGYMVRNTSGPMAKSLLGRGKTVARAVLPAGVKEKIKSTLGGERLKRIQAAEKDSFYSSIDWSKTVAYSEPGRHVININLAGRNRDGIVATADYASTCRRIIDDLGDWKDANGKLFVERVARRDEVYAGPFVGRASDLYVYWNATAEAGPPPDEVQARGFWWSGDHRREGILIGQGPGIRAGRAGSVPTVYDFVPTVMYASGLRIPADLDGRVVEEAFTEDFKSKTPIRIDSGASASSRNGPHLTDDEEREVEEKLRSLGYL
jgi:predicted AlkP superfamily phosphohydrolase/phosphomutase